VSEIDVEADDFDEQEQLTLIAQEKPTWVKTTTDNLNFEIDEAILKSSKPIKNRDQLDERIRLLAVHILKFHDFNKIMRKTVAQYFIEIKEAGENLGYDKVEISKIAKEIFLQYGISESHIRKIIPHELKDQSRTNIRYRPDQPLMIEHEASTSLEDMPTDTEIQLKNAIERIKDLELKVRHLKDQLSNSIMIGQETKVYKGKVALDRDRNLPLIVAINLKDDRLEYIEIDTEAIRQASESV
jgi:hypothetical protein